MKKFLFIFGIPVLLITIFFPYQNRIYYGQPYAQSAAIERGSVVFTMDLPHAPQIIPALTTPPVLSAVGIPERVFAYKFCAEYKSSYQINNTYVMTDFNKRDVRIKLGDYTHHLEPNSSICYFFNDSVEYYFGDILIDQTGSLIFMNENGIDAMNGTYEITFYEKPIYPKWIMFIVCLVTFLPIFWAIVIACNQVREIFDKKLSRGR